MKPTKRIPGEQNASSDNRVDEDELTYLLHEENSVVSKRQYFSNLSPEGTEPVSPPQTINNISNQEQTQDSFSKLSNREHSDGLDIQINDDFSQERALALICQEFADVIEEFKNEVLLAPKRKFPNDPDSLIKKDITTEPSSIEDDLLLFALEYSNDDSLGEEIDSDWLALAGEVEEFNIEATSSFDDVEVDGAIEDTERALQAAMEVGSSFELEKGQVFVVATMFEKNGWGNCRIAVERELKQGRSIEELQLASELKELWLEHYEFYSGQASNYRILSWPTALRLANSFRGYPSPEEVEHLLTILYYHWSRDRVLRCISTSFNEYLIACIGYVEHEDEFAFEWIMEQELLYTDTFFMPPGTEDIPVLGDYELERALQNVRRNSTWMNEGFCQ